LVVIGEAKLFEDLILGVVRKGQLPEVDVSEHGEDGATGVSVKAILFMPFSLKSVANIALYREKPWVNIEND
jgi:hypothetical protein